MYHTCDFCVRASNVDIDESPFSIEDEHHVNVGQLFSINNELYSFIKEHFYEMNQELIFVTGEEETGKSIFVKKVSDYLKGRGKINQYMIIDFRADSIGSVAEFRIEF